MTTFLIILGILFVIIGLLGTIYPAIPGLGLMFGGAWLLAYTGDYQIVGTKTLIFLSIITIAGTLMDYVAGMLGAKFTGASKKAIWGSLIGGIIGAFFSLPGLLLGPLLGAGVGEFSARKDLWNAGKVSVGTFVGFIIGVVAKLGCALVIVLTLIVSTIVHLI
ncbi:DUF456 domain-containing protein [Neisseria weaveri]|uniref:DUF456 domain-containing protein n=1 Tax=Neisseria weaveri TaxID=28091 RepID=UPI0007C99B86|nr:DUF456 family protein [Neisseria weaveri]SAY50500.1 Membrane protein [Neisseria weaveri]